MERIGPYEILGLLHGGQRPLCRARAADGRVVALKTMPVAGLTLDARERFAREAAICKELDHPNLVRVYDSGEADGFLYQAMDRLEGADLSRVLAERRPLSWDQKISIMEQVCEGLEYAHARRLVHRDIKPANLFLENSGRVRILDFGMARVDASQLTRAGAAVGTLTYMAPEQIRGETCTPGSDVFAAGIVFYELATGKHPFATGDASVSDILTGVLFQNPTPLKDLAPDAPEGLDLVLGKALEKAPAGRLQNAGDFKQALALCKITLKLRPAAAAAGPGPAEAADPGKTVVVRRTPRPEAPPQRPPERPGSPRAEPPPKPAPKPASKPAPKPEQVFCPSCTYGNPKGATTCLRCGLPLATPKLPAPDFGDRRLQWAVIGVIVTGVLVLLFLLFASVGSR